MHQPLEWPPEHLLEPARRKYGLLLATIQLGWKSTPEVAGHLWRRLRDHMAGQPENCSARGGGGAHMDARRRRGGGLENRGFVLGLLFCVRTDVSAEGAGTQNLA